MITPRAVLRLPARYLVAFHRARHDQAAPAWLEEYLQPSAKKLDLPFQYRSVYRGLLRAAGYLPDSVARKYAVDTIKNRFQDGRAKSLKARKKAKKLGSFTRKIDVHGLARLRKAKSSRNLLEKAGDGDTEAMMKVLMFVYGRQGERKRRLLKALLSNMDGDLTKGLAIQQMVNNASSKGLELRPNEKLYNFIKIQQANQPVELERQKIRRAGVKIPKETLWGRPVPVKVQKRILEKWWAVTMEKLLPPIPRHEWNRLRDLATGAMPLEKQPPRRTLPSESGTQAKFLPGTPSKVGGWYCSRKACGYHNPTEGKVCARCQTPRRPGTDTPPYTFGRGEWVCTCGCYNFAKREVCFKCGDSRPTSLPKVEEAHGNTKREAALEHARTLETRELRRLSVHITRGLPKDQAQEVVRQTSEGNAVAITKHDIYQVLNERKWGLEIEKPEEGKPQETKQNETTQEKSVRERSMRRVYASIWSMTPTGEYDAESKTWKIEWGGPKSAAYAGKITKPTAKDLELFEGIEKFELPAERKGRRSKRADRPASPPQMSSVT